MTLAAPDLALGTERLLLRQPQAADLPAYTAYCASARSHFVRGPFTEAQAFEKFATMIGHWTLRRFGRYVIEWQGQPIGHVGPLAITMDEPPELTWTLWDARFEGQGFATEAARRVRDHLLSERAWPALDVLVLPANTASLRIAEKLGATDTGKPAPDWYPGCRTLRLTAEVPA